VAAPRNLAAAAIEPTKDQDELALSTCAWDGAHVEVHVEVPASDAIVILIMHGHRQQQNSVVDDTGRRTLEYRPVLCDVLSLRTVDRAVENFCALRTTRSQVCELAGDVLFAIAPWFRRRCAVGLDAFGRAGSSRCGGRSSSTPLDCRSQFHRGSLAHSAWQQAAPPWQRRFF